MWNPVDLPAELFGMVIDYAINDEVDFESLYNFCLGDRQWYGRLCYRLYFKWTYDGDEHSFTLLWKFLRTMLHNAKLAAYVRVLDIRYWGFFSDSPKGVDFPQEDLSVIHDAVRKAGMQELELSIDEAIRNNDCRPLMALLLTVLPILRSIYALVPKYDPYLAKVLTLSLGNRENKLQQQALQNLEEAQLTRAWHYYPYSADDRDVDEYPYILGLDYLWPIFRLPNLRKLSVFEFEHMGASVCFAGCAGTCPVTHLTLVTDVYSRMNALDAHSLLTLPKALVSLYIYLDDSCVPKIPHGDAKQISNDELWSALEPHRDSLEQLDFYRDCSLMLPPTHSPRNSHFGTLRAFKRLNHLCIQPETLIGGCCGEPMAPFRLRDTLPLTLNNLTFYGADLLLRNESLGDQICEVLESSDFIQLTTVLLEDLSCVNICYEFPVHLTYSKVQRACGKRKVSYRKVNGNELRKGGSELPYFREALEMQMEKQVERSKWRKRREEAALGV